MPSSILTLIFLSLCLGTGVWLLFLYAVKRGEYDDVEGPKYRMLDDEDPEPGQEEKNAAEEEEPHD